APRARGLERRRAQANGELVFTRRVQLALRAQPIREALERSRVRTGGLQLDSRQDHRAAMTVAARESRLIQSDLAKHTRGIAAAHGESLTRRAHVEQRAKRLFARDVADAAADGACSPCKRLDLACWQWLGDLPPICNVLACGVQALQGRVDVTFVVTQPKRESSAEDTPVLRVQVPVVKLLRGQRLDPYRLREGVPLEPAPDGAQVGGRELPLDLTGLPGAVCRGRDRGPGMGRDGLARRVGHGMARINPN